MRSTILTAALLAALPCSAKTIITGLRALDYSGQIQVKRADGTMAGLVADRAAPEIPSGSQVLVLKGEAVFQAGELLVEADKGDVFSFSETGGIVSIIATGKRTQLRLAVGKALIALKPGDGVSVSPATSAGSALTSMSGDLSVDLGDGAPKVLTPGQSLMAPSGQPRIKARSRAKNR